MSDAKISYSIIGQSDNNNYNCYQSRVLLQMKEFILIIQIKLFRYFRFNLKLKALILKVKINFWSKINFEIIPFVDNDLKEVGLKNKNFL